MLYDCKLIQYKGLGEVAFGKILLKKGEMKKTLFYVLFLTGLSLNCCSQNTKVDKSKKDTAAIKSRIEQYKLAFENADTLLASKLWLHTNEVSFIHPRGHEHGWEEIKNNIYKFFGNNFSKRNLSIFNVKVNVYNDVAWTEFYWVFDATFRKDNSPLQTKGRETEVWKKVSNEWYLVNLHYSNMPVTGQRQRF